MVGNSEIYMKRHSCWFTPLSTPFIHYYLLTLLGIRIDNSRYGPFWHGRSIWRMGVSLLEAHKHILFYLKADFNAYLMV